MKEETDAAKPPLTLADLSEEQAIQIAKMAYGDAENGFKVDRADTGSMGLVSVRFWGQQTSEKARYLVSIDAHFDVWLQYENGYLVASNQRAIQKLLTEWGAE